MPYRVDEHMRPTNLLGSFLAGQDARYQQQNMKQRNALLANEAEQQKQLNALMADPNATPDQYARAGRSDISNALTATTHDKQQEAVDNAKKLLAGADYVLQADDPHAIARQLFPDFVNTVEQQHGRGFFDSMPGDAIKQSISHMRDKAAADIGVGPAPPKLETTGDLAHPEGGVYQTDPATGAIKQVVAPKDNSITPYQQAQLGIEGQRLGLEREKVKQGGQANTNQLNTNVAKLRDDYSQTVNKTGWADQQGFYQRLKSIGNDKTGASDLALVFSFMKVLDPTSAVREGEYANAQNTAGIPGKIVAQYNKVLSGAFLAPTQRTEFLNSADKIYATAFKRQQAIKADFTGKAQRLGANPQDVIIDTGAPDPGAGPAQVTQAPPQAVEHLRQHPELKAAFQAKYGYLP